MSKNSNNPFGVVFSTDPNFKFEPLEPDEIEALAPEKQVLRIHLERLKGNKEATIVRGFLGSDDDLAALAKTLKNKCAAGGGVRDDGDIVVQGNHRDKILAALVDLGYSKTKKAGG